MFYMTTPTQEPHPEQQQGPRGEPRPRRRSGPPFPPSRIWAAIQYVGQCQMSLQPFKKEKSSHGPIDSDEYETWIEERDLHPAQIGSYRAACDLLTSYFNGEGWREPRGLRTREAYQEFLGILDERRKQAVE